MKLVILTQEDSFTIPRNIEKIYNLTNVELLMIVNIKSKFSLENNKKMFLKGFGIFQVLKIGFLSIIRKILNFLEINFGLFLSQNPSSLKSVAKKIGIRYLEINDPNQEEFLIELAKHKPDLIVSFSAPVIFREQLLSLPIHGCINLHCSLLPNFAGVMPSFWTLYKKQSDTGVTVHKMDSKIDNGLILKQCEVEIKNDETIFSLILKTKEIGGDLMCRAITEIMTGEISYKENRTENGSYFSWPTVKDFKDFRKNGGRLI
jgi:methionyl-tRNA formyltransferase